MKTQPRASTSDAGNLALQGANATQLADLQRHEMEVQLRASDLQVQIGQLREQQVLVGPDNPQQFNKPLAAAEHDLAAARLDYDATHAKIMKLETVDQGGVATIWQSPPNPIFGREQLEMTGLGVFLLMIPIVLAFARRIWIRSGVKAQPQLDLESSPRLQRLEEAVESIAIEVERIGEAQRFAVKLLSERRPEVASRVSPSSPANALREPGTITPH